MPKEKQQPELTSYEAARQHLAELFASRAWTRCVERLDVPAPIDSGNTAEVSGVEASATADYSRLLHEAKPDKAELAVTLSLLNSDLASFARDRNAVHEVEARIAGYRQVIMALINALPAIDVAAEASRLANVRRQAAEQELNEAVRVANEAAGNYEAHLPQVRIGLDALRRWREVSVLYSRLLGHLPPTAGETQKATAEASYRNGAWLRPA